MSTCVMEIIDSFVRQRQFMVVIDDSNSNRIMISAGLAQRTVLSPLLFSVHIIDMPSPPYIASFADDTALFASAKKSTKFVKRLNTAIALLDSYILQTLLTWRIQLKFENNARQKTHNRTTHWRWVDLYLSIFIQRLNNNFNHNCEKSNFPLNRALHTLWWDLAN